MKIVQKLNNALTEFGLRDGCSFVVTYLLWRRLGIIKDDNDTEKSIFIKTLDQRVSYRPFSSDFDVVVEFFFNRGNQLQYDLDIQSLLGKAPEYILDAGANIGLFSCLYAQKYNPKIIVAAEPETENFQLLKKNVQEYGCIIPMQTACWNKKAKIAVIPSEMGNWGFTVEETEMGDIEAMSISDIMKLNGIPYFDIVKMDIEGSEFYIFSDDSCKTWIDKTSMIIIETHDRKVEGCSEAVLTRLCNDFSYFMHNENFVFVRKMGAPTLE